MRERACVRARGKPSPPVGTQVERSYTHQYARALHVWAAVAAACTQFYNRVPPSHHPWGSRVAPRPARLRRFIPGASPRTATHPPDKTSTAARLRRARVCVCTSRLASPRAHYTPLSTSSTATTSSCSSAPPDHHPTRAPAARYAFTDRLDATSPRRGGSCVTLSLAAATDTWRPRPTTLRPAAAGLRLYDTSEPPDTDRYRIQTRRHYTDVHTYILVRVCVRIPCVPPPHTRARRGSLYTIYTCSPTVKRDLSRWTPAVPAADVYVVWNRGGEDRSAFDGGVAAFSQRWQLVKGGEVGVRKFDDLMCTNNGEILTRKIYL